MLTDGGKKQIFITDDTLASTQFIAENAVFTLVKLFGPLTIHLHSIFFIRTIFIRNKAEFFHIYYVELRNIILKDWAWADLACSYKIIWSASGLSVGHWSVNYRVVDLPEFWRFCIFSLSFKQNIEFLEIFQEILSILENFVIKKCSLNINSALKS